MRRQVNRWATENGGVATVTAIRTEDDRRYVEFTLDEWRTKTTLIFLDVEARYLAHQFIAASSVLIDMYKEAHPDG